MQLLSIGKQKIFDTFPYVRSFSLNLLRRQKLLIPGSTDFDVFFQFRSAQSELSPPGVHVRCKCFFSFFLSFRRLFDLTQRAIFCPPISVFLVFQQKSNLFAHTFHTDVMDMRDRVKSPFDLCPFICSWL